MVTREVRGNTVSYLNSLLMLTFLVMSVYELTSRLLRFHYIMYYMVLSMDAELPVSIVSKILQL